MESNIGSISNTVSGKENKGCKYSAKTSWKEIINNNPKRGGEEFYPIITIAGFLRLWDLYNAYNVAIRVENITLLWIETAKRLWFNAMSVCFGAFHMLWCYRTFAKQQNATLLLQRLNCCHLARSGLKVLKAQAIYLYNVWAAGKDDSSLWKNQIENDKALESSSSIIEELVKRSLD